ncbi:hypothetical protein JA1_001982 [Spathaspora sp. JA1]|nr:hypothetical protein JA1_001982 [Spathaspora sp. JA1]
MENILKRQQESIRRLYLNNIAEPGLKRKRYGLVEFGQIYGHEYIDYDSKQLLQDMREIGNMISKGTAYRNLHQVLLNEVCFFVQRERKDGVYLLPCNTLGYNRYKLRQGEM